jgi:two-component system, NarL family, response regulator LiaR
MTGSILPKENNQTKNRIAVMVVDDHPLVRHALKSLIETQADMKVIAEADNGEKAVDLAKRLLPNVVIMDIGMPVMNGLEATQQIKAQCPSVAILVLTVHTDKEHVIGILEAGAAGYLTKVTFGDEVIRAIRAIAGGEAVLTPSILQEILKHVSLEPPKITLPQANNLTAREIYILKLAAKGLNNKNIASKLKITENTVKSHLTDIFVKINVSSRTEAVMFGLRAGLININDLE